MKGRSFHFSFFLSFYFMRKPNPIFEDVTITNVAAEGKALGRYGEMVVFVPYAVPGDVVDIQVTKKRKTMRRAA